MHAARLLIAIGLAGVATAVAPGCRGATQMTVDVRAVDATCSELKGTSVTVGVDPGDTESRVAQGFVNASTTACTEASGEIGTLVVTPSDAKRGAVVVVVAYGSTTDPSKCQPPAYKGCIVARRSFAFVDHEGLRLPITISPDCLDVPCDAFSTCRHGQCFSSDVQCSGAGCNEPGAIDDGGTAPGTTPPPPPSGPNEPYCDGTTLHCHPSGDALGDVACGGVSQSCCSRGGFAQCGAPTTCAGHSTFCCSDSDCASGHCVRPSGVMGGVVDEAGIPEGGAFDAGSDDAGATVDAGAFDAGTVDAGSADAGSDGGTTIPPASGVGFCE